MAWTKSKYPPKLYSPGQSDPFKLSRSKIDLFLECPRCFYLDRRLGVARPSIPAFTLNSAVDTLLKNEFDLLRKEARPHDLMQKYGVDAIPFNHPQMDSWRDVFSGIQYLHPDTNFLVFGAIDDVWVDPQGQLSIVDYKSTSTDKTISLDDKWKQGYKLQMEVYQWLFRQNDFSVSPTGYFVFANAAKNRPRFDGKLEFELSIISYEGKTDWLPSTLSLIKTTLEDSKIPSPGPECEYCVYAKSRFQSLSQASRQNN